MTARRLADQRHGRKTARSGGVAAEFRRRMTRADQAAGAFARVDQALSAAWLEPMVSAGRWRVIEVAWKNGRVSSLT
ncbi:MAG: hypothetical protein ABIJ48_11950 [Actinomycetota bacterium]